MISVDRIEGKTAVLEADGKMINVPLEKLPEGVSEGDILVLKSGVYEIDAAATEARRQAIFDLQESL